jgi:hypothetical protein
MTFSCESGYADPCLRLMDPDPDSDFDPAIFIIDFQDANCILLLEGTYRSFTKDKK